MSAPEGGGLAGAELDARATPRADPRADSGTGMRVGDRPILPLWLRGGVLAFALCAVVTALVTGPVGNPGGGTIANHERGAVTASRALHFVDDAGDVRVVDALDGTEIERIVRGRDGFVRSVMRGLARERMSRSLDASAAFALVMHDDGSLWLDDPMTGRQVVLSAFGTDNVAAFARMLVPGDAGAVGAAASAAAFGGDTAADSDRS